MAERGPRSARPRKIEARAPVDHAVGLGVQRGVADLRRERGDEVALELGHAALAAQAAQAEQPGNAASAERAEQHDLVRARPGAREAGSRSASRA